MSTPRPVTPLSILAAELVALREELGEAAPGRLHRLCALAGGLDGYVAEHTTPESPALRALAARTAAADWSGDGPLEQEMLSGHVEGQALKLLVHTTRARRVLEIGMFTGYSALAMAEALPPDGVLVACELDPGVAAFAQECFAAAPEQAAKITVEVGPAAESLTRLAQEEPFDLVFVDADKGGYAAYVRTVLDSGLLAPGGLLCVDNTLLQGEPWLPEPSPNGAAIAAFNTAVAQDPRVEQVLLPLRDGLTLIRRV